MRHLGISQCSVDEENFEQYVYNENISPQSDKWSIQNNQSDGIIRTVGEVNQCVFIYRSFELPSAYVRYNHNNPSSINYSIGIDLFVPSSSTGAKMFFVSSSGNYILDLFLNDGGNGQVTNVNDQSINFSYPKDEYFTLFLNFNNGFLTVVTDDAYGVIPFSSVIAAIDFCGDNGSYYICNICIDEEASDFQYDEEIECGVTYSRDTRGKGNDYQMPLYNNECGFNSSSIFDGADYVFKFKHDNPSNPVGITMFQSGNSNLSMFIFDVFSGQNVHCIDKASNYPSNNNNLGEAIYFTFLPAGDYYIVIDGANPNEEGPFSLTVTCGALNCTEAIPIQCGETIEGSNDFNSNAENNVSFYTCDNGTFGQIGRESIYEFSLTKEEEVIITLDGFSSNEDFELFLINDQCSYECIESETSPAGNAEVITVTLGPGVYYIAVDSWRAGNSLLPTTGDFILKLEGCDNFCDLVYADESKTNNNYVEFKNETGFDIAYFTVSYPYINGNEPYDWVEKINPDEALGLSYYCPSPGCYYFCFYYFDHLGRLQECCFKYCAEFDNPQCEDKPYLISNFSIGQNLNRCVFSCEEVFQISNSSGNEVDIYYTINGERYESSNGELNVDLPSGQYEVCCYKYNEECDYYEVCCQTYCFPYIESERQCEIDRFLPTDDASIYEWVWEGGFVVEFAEVSPDAAISSNTIDNNTIITLSLPTPGTYQVCYFSDTGSEICCEYICWDGAEDDECIKYRYISSNKILVECADEKNIKYWSLGCYCPDDIICVCEAPEIYYGEKAIITLEENAKYTLCKVYEECCGQETQCCIDICNEPFNPYNSEVPVLTECEDIIVNNLTFGGETNSIALTFNGLENNGTWVIYREIDGDNFEVAGSGGNERSIEIRDIKWIPGYYYYICYQSIGEDLCPVYCCKKIYVPFECDYIHIDDGTSGSPYSYSFNYEGGIPDTDVINWFINGSAFTGINTLYTFPYTGDYYVCLLLKNRKTKEYTLCCKKFCIRPRIGCGETISGNNTHVPSNYNYNNLHKKCIEQSNLSFNGGDLVYSFIKRNPDDVINIELRHGSEDNLALRILDSCGEDFSCDRGLNNTETGTNIGEDWSDEGNYPPGQYFIVVDGAENNDQYEGPFTLYLDCESTCIDPDLIDPDGVCQLNIDPVCGCNGVTYQNECWARIAGVTKWTHGPCSQLCEDPTIIYLEDFESFNIGDDITKQNTNLSWEIGNCLPNGRDLEGIVGNIGSNVLELNYGNYEENDVFLKIVNNPRGIFKIEFDAGLNYDEKGVLYDAVIKIPVRNNLDDVGFLTLRVGNSGNIGSKDKRDNYAKLIYDHSSFLGATQTELADLKEISNYQTTGGIHNFKISYIINFNDGAVSFYVNNSLRYKGIQYFSYMPGTYFGIEFFNHEKGQSALYLDNICISSCKSYDCPPPKYNDHCGSLNFTKIIQNSDNLVQVSLKAENIQSSSQNEWVIAYEEGGQMVEDVSDISASTLNNYHCIPGRTYYFCYKYYGESDCPQYCCIKLEIPFSCSNITPYYLGEENDLEYSFNISGLGNNETVSQWYLEGDDLGNSEEVIYSYDISGTGYVCCLIWDSFRNCYRLCCRKVCIENANECDKIDIDYDYSNDRYILSAIGVQNVISWNIDVPSNLPNNGYIGNTNPQIFDPNDFNVSAFDEIIISVRYIDGDGCIKVCCRRICYEPISECDFITYDPINNGLNYAFNFNNPDADLSERIIWSIEGQEMDESETNPIFDLSSYEGQNISCCVYYRDKNGCWRYCCIGLTPLPGNLESVEFFIDDQCGNIGEQIDIPIKVNNFDELISFQFSLGTSNQNLVEIVSITPDSNFPGQMNRDLTANGNYSIIWFPTQPVTAPDGTTIATVRVNLKGNIGTSALLNFSSTPTPISTENLQGLVPVSTNGGEICIEGIQSSSLCGTIQREDGLKIANVEVTLNGPSSSVTTITDAEGNYCFEEVEHGNDYTITPYLNIGVTDGVTSSDLFFLNRHIAGISKLNSPYKHISGDVNNDKRIASSDLFFLNRVVARISDSFINNTSWRFVDAVQNLPLDPLNSSVNESISINDLSGDENGLNFIACKTGDVNNSLISFSPFYTKNKVLRKVSTREETVDLIFPDVEIEENQTFEMDLKVTNFENMISFSFSIEWDTLQLEYLGIEQTDPNFNPNGGTLNAILTGEKTLAVTWFSPGNAVTLQDSTSIFKLLFKATELATISELTITDNPTPVVMESFDGVNLTTETVSIHNGTVSKKTYDSLEVIANITDVMCQGFTTGAIDLSVSGGSGNYIFTWSNGSMEEDILSLSAGAYGLTIVDTISNDTTIQIFTINEPDSLILQSIVQTETNGTGNGTAMVLATGGIPPYSYEWDDANSQTGIIASMLSAGIYNCLVTDANGCIETIRVEIINQNTAFNISANIVHITCNGVSDGSIEMLVSGGSESFSYLWSNGSTTNLINNIAAGTYSVTITDNNSAQEEVVSGLMVTEPESIGSQIVILNETDGLDNGSVTLSVTGGTPPYAYIWDDQGGQTSSLVSGLSAGVYSCTITDANDCEEIVMAVIMNINSAISTEFNIMDVLCFGEDNGSIALNVSGGSGSFGYQWSTGAIENPLVNLIAGGYDVTITDSNSGQEVFLDNLEVQQPEELIIETMVENATNNEPNGTATITPSGGIAPYTYKWNDKEGQETQKATGLAEGEYTVTVTDANGCQKSKTVGIINENTAIDILESTLTEMQVMPNPFDETLYLRFRSQISANLQIVLMDMTGQVIYKTSNYFENGSHTLRIDGEHLSSGVYLMRVTDGEGVANRKVVKM